MKFYTSPNSPFGARVTIAARVKGIVLDHVGLPAGGLRSPEYLALNPIAKIPVLVTEAGTVIPESQAILNYLEDRFPEPSLRPRDPDQRACLNVLIQIVDAYVMTPIIRTFPHLDPTKRDRQAVEHEVGRWKHGMAVLAHFMKSPLPQAQAPVSLADCVLPVSLHLNTRIAGMLGLDQDPIKPHGVLAAYYDRMKRNAIVGPILAELTAAQESSDLKSGRPSLAHLH